MKKLNVLGILIFVVLFVLSVGIASAQESEPLQLWRFFNECADQYTDVTEITDNTDVCAINQILANRWNAENPDLQVETTVLAWPGTIELNSALAAGDAPDIMSMHAFRIPIYASRGVLTPLTPYLEEAGIDVSDILPNVLDAVTYEGEIYAIPIDIHGLLWTINLDLWAAAGLVDADGNPVLPVGREEFIAACQAVGSPILDAGADNNLSTILTWFSFYSQLGGSVVDADGNPTVNNQSGLDALNMMIEFMDLGCMTRGEIGASYESFVAGDIGGVIAGTWQVNEFDRQIRENEGGLENLYVAPFPTVGNQPGIWGGSHIWVLPQGPDADPARVRESLAYLKFFWDHNLDWTRTGHSTVRMSVLESESYLSLPHRTEYDDFSRFAVYEPNVLWMTAFEAIMHEEIQAAILGEKTPEAALEDAQFRLDDFAAFQN